MTTARTDLAGPTKDTFCVIQHSVRVCTKLIYTVIARYYRAVRLVNGALADLYTLLRYDCLSRSHNHRLVTITLMETRHEFTKYLHRVSLSRYACISELLTLTELWAGVRLEGYALTLGSFCPMDIKQVKSREAICTYHPLVHVSSSDSLGSDLIY
jgi:hypothetical protein